MRDQPKRITTMTIITSGQSWCCESECWWLTLGSEALVILRQVCENGEAIWHLVGEHIGRIEQWRDSQAFLGYSEGELIVLVNVVLVQLVKVTARGWKQWWLNYRVGLYFQLERVNMGTEKEWKQQNCMVTSGTKVLLSLRLYLSIFLLRCQPVPVLICIRKGNVCYTLYYNIVRGKHNT